MIFIVPIAGYYLVKTLIELQIVFKRYVSPLN